MKKKIKREFVSVVKALDECMSGFGFNFVPPDNDPVKHIFVWEKKLSETLLTNMFFSISAAIESDKLNVEPLVMIDSVFVAESYRELGLFQDGGRVSSVVVPKSMQVIRFFPAHIRWQDNLDIEYSTLSFNENFIDLFVNDFSDVMKNFVMPIVEQLSSPLQVANFQLRADEFMSTRLPCRIRRYEVMSEYISTALLLIESGNKDSAIELLNQILRKKEIMRSGLHPVYFERLFWQIEKVLANYRQ
ncbi:hypothetical protein ACFOLJ_06440 [Rugamonas sp. CCM 8940]|uniref:hypothetical protein n=1 Tax=Rugamonas sp. CCM 8940 TaxID=2765359 RepID=UPI0018F7A12C|nr:hypothetical protein [Rugamonas sp. CCM 8940]MBJ7310407.1 hypothetical protein [Rugamonas sp. CCM 8940]